MLPSTTDIFDFPGLEAVADFSFTISAKDFALQNSPHVRSIE